MSVKMLALTRYDHKNKKRKLMHSFTNEQSFEDENLGSIVVEAKHKEGTLTHPVSTLFDAYKLRDMPVMKEYDEVNIVITRGDGNTETITPDSPNIFNN